MVDIYHSRRGHFKSCTYWLRDESDRIGDLTTWVLKTTPSGIFYAKETTPITNQANQTNNVFIYDKNMVSLETYDDINDIKRGCVVLYNGTAWFVDSVQKKIIIKESEFQNVDKALWVINLRK